MPWEFLPGVHSAVGQITGPGTAVTDTTTPVDVKAVLAPGNSPRPTPENIFGPPPAPLNAIRTITWADQADQFSNGFAGQVSKLRDFAQFGVFTIPCFSCHQSSWATTSAANWRSRLITFADQINDFSTVIEIGNEPKLGDFATDGTGPYFNKLLDAIPICHARGLEVISAGMPTGGSLDMLTGLHNVGTPNSIFNASTGIDGYGLHPYYMNSNGPLVYTPGGGGSVPNQIDWVAKCRDILSNGYGATGTDIWITEFGWHTQFPASANNIYAIAGHGSGAQGGQQDPNSNGGQATKMDTGFNQFSINAQDLRIRAAAWFSFQDYVYSGTAWDHACGLRSDTPAAWKKDILWTLGNMAGAAPAPTSPPTNVVTQPATNITTNSAVLHGTLNPAGSDTHYHFEYKAG